MDKVYANVTVGRADVARENCRLGVQLSRAGKPFAAAPPIKALILPLLFCSRMFVR
jgi:hypothetical protein